MTRAKQPVRGRLPRTIMRFSLPVFLAALILGLPACGARPPATHVPTHADGSNEGGETIETLGRAQPRVQ